MLSAYLSRFFQRSNKVNNPCDKYIFRWVLVKAFEHADRTSPRIIAFHRKDCPAAEFSNIVNSDLHSIPHRPEADIRQANRNSPNSLWHRSEERRVGKE